MLNIAKQISLLLEQAQSLVRGACAIRIRKPLTPYNCMMETLSGFYKLSVHGFVGYTQDNCKGGSPARSADAAVGYLS